MNTRKHHTRVIGRRGLIFGTIAVAVCAVVGLDKKAAAQLPGGSRLPLPPLALTHAHIFDYMISL
ncbi:MAG: hypothetical protein JWP15_202 [Alphaproteobacteria bacterium]|nr:hypothetical protein [Alphaproteobacteria bacterium]